MKYLVLSLALATTVIAAGQKKEIRNVGKAIEARQYEMAGSIFGTIDKNEVPEKLMGDYTFYKAVTSLGNPADPNVSDDKLREIMILFDVAESLGYDDQEMLVTYKNATIQAIFRGAQKMLAAGEVRSALNSVNYLVEIDSTNQGMRESAAALAYQLGDYESAQKNYEILFEQGYTGIQESVVATDIDKKQDVNFPNMKAAKIGVASGKYKDARIERTDSRLGFMVTNLASIYKRNDQLDKAKQLFEDIQSKYPGDQGLKLANADIYLVLGNQEKYEEAINDFGSDIKDPLVFEKLGIAAGEKKNWDLAIKYYKRSIELQPDNYVTQNNIAAAYVNLGNEEKTTAEQQTEYYTTATKHLEEVLKLKPNLASSKQTLLGLYDFLDMKEKAEALRSGN